MHGVPGQRLTALRDRCAVGLRGATVALLADGIGLEKKAAQASCCPDTASGGADYACRTGQGRAAAVSIGLRPTFQTGRGVLIEAFVLDFTGDLYGQDISLTFVERLRGEERFDGIEALVAQMNRDVERTRQVVPVNAGTEA